MPPKSILLNKKKYVVIRTGKDYLVLTPSAVLKGKKRAIDLGLKPKKYKKRRIKTSKPTTTKEGKREYQRKLMRLRRKEEKN